MPRTWTRVILIAALAAALFLVFDFGQRALIFLNLAQYEQQTQEKLVRAQATQTALVAKRNYAQSDESVERTARGWGWARAEDTVVRTNATPTAIPYSQPRPAAPSEKNIFDLLREWLSSLMQ